MENASRLPERFGCMVFGDDVMRASLAPEVYEALKKTTERGEELTQEVADAVAEAMKVWAMERGATHFTHWFQPMTGITAEKHDSFLEPAGNGKILMEFSGKSLIKGEPDASSFPSGGLRATFEARGYTAWDPTSPAFIKEGTLYIPTAFCSFGGAVLDKKTPLLRSMDCVERSTGRLLSILGIDTEVTTTVGAEQEYFLIDRRTFERRKDLFYTGRTLFGAKPPKRQELSDHYYGIIKPRVAAYMEEVDKELWKLGVSAKTEHNEAAPAQHELAPIFTKTNIACDHNQLTMEVMQRVAKKHGMICLLHEKPFANVSGSGKHNNWSIQTNTGVNLFKPGDTPAENAQFLLFLCAVIQAVDDYADLLRLSVASPSNDHRLGSHEAPPAVVSIFLGTELEEILDAIEKDVPYNAQAQEPLRLGVHTLPKLPRDNTDRNRTSPFAFTGNKFEFRMLGSSDSIACTNIMLNTAVAESLRLYADELEGAEDFESALHALIRRTVSEHKRIIFSGNGYDEAWIREATEVRGLPNYPSTPDCVPQLTAEKNLKLFAQHKIYTPVEAASRRDVILDNYCKVLHIEALTMIDMVRRDILPAISKFTGVLAESGRRKREFCIGIDTDYEFDTIRNLSELTTAIVTHTVTLENFLEKLSKEKDIVTLAHGYRDLVFGTMELLRAAVDEAETLTGSEYWPYPTYGDLMFSVK